VTIRIPKWLLWAVLGVVVIAGIAAAFFIGRSSSDNGGAALTQGGTAATSTEASTAAAPECSGTQAKRAVVSSEFETSVRRLGVASGSEPLISPHASPPGYSIGKLVCRDLTGDGAEEMLVQLVCCTSGAFSPWAIFMAEDGQWRLAFHRAGVPATLSIQGDAIVEKTPVYGPDDPLCCPSTFRFGRAAWDGTEFAYRSNEGSPERTIRAGTRGVSRLGAFTPQSGSPFDAAKAFGPPSSTTPDDELCRESWLDLGLVINFANLGGADPCSAAGRVGSIQLQGELAEQAGWKTEEGATVGMTLHEVRSIYPDAKPDLHHVLVLIEGPSAVGTGGTYPVLSARIANEKFSELEMFVGAAGE
jgi:hypothetical protein